MLELRYRNEELWPPELQRRGDDTFNPEPFCAWWERVQKTLGHLNPLIAEQWVYRHFRSTHFRFLPLGDLTWRREAWTTAEFFGRTHLEWGAPADPAHDFEAFTAADIATVRGWHNGTWDIPPVLLETPDGIRSYDGAMPDVRFLVVEGSKRYRYLNALWHRGTPTGPHDIFVIKQGD